jgi:hypothetical protein
MNLHKLCIFLCQTCRIRIGRLLMQVRIWIRKNDTDPTASRSTTLAGNGISSFFYCRVRFQYDMSNRAQLPCGIENIRPHLDTMDNVPLLVSLFTDSSPGSQFYTFSHNLWIQKLSHRIFLMTVNQENVHFYLFSWIFVGAFQIDRVIRSYLFYHS